MANCNILVFHISLWPKNQCLISRLANPLTYGQVRLGYYHVCSIASETVQIKKRCRVCEFRYELIIRLGWWSQTIRTRSTKHAASMTRIPIPIYVCIQYSRQMSRVSLTDFHYYYLFFFIPQKYYTTTSVVIFSWATRQFYKISAVPVCL